MKRSKKQVEATINERRLISAHRKRPMSKGEARISAFLSDNKLDFIREYVVFVNRRNCSRRILTFDFFVKDYNLAIEYDGEHHSLPIRGQKALEAQKMRDAHKGIYCASKGINLLRIPYTEFDNIERIICDRCDRISPNF